MHSENSVELREVLERAQEIDSETGVLLRQNPEWADMIEAAEEAGVPREAILEALRERVGAVATDFGAGELVFATSGNGWFNPAKIETVRNGRARVRFLGGGEAEVDLRDVKSFGLAPGDSIYINYYGTWTKVEVGSFNRDSLSVTTNYYGMHETRSLEGVRLKDPRFAKPLKDQAKLWTYMVASFVSGGMVAGLIALIANR